VLMSVAWFLGTGNKCFIIVENGGDAHPPGPLPSFHGEGGVDKEVFFGFERSSKPKNTLKQPPPAKWEGVGGGEFYASL
jgi:hypothetical protein